MWRFRRNTIDLDHYTYTITHSSASLKRNPWQPHFTTASWGQLDQLARRPPSRQLNSLTSIGCPPTNAMPTLRCTSTPSALDPSPCLCFWSRALVPRPSRGHGYSSTAPNSMSPASLPSMRLDCPDAVLPLQDPTLSPLRAMVFRKCFVS